MKEILYQQSSILIVAGLLACMLIALEAGFINGRRKKSTVTDSMRSQVNAVLGSMLVLLALMLSFTFSLAMQRYEARSQAVVVEVNAFGTAYLRTQLLPEAMQDEAQTLLRQLLDVRIRESDLLLKDVEKREPLLQQGNLLSEQLWRQAVEAAESGMNPIIAGLFIQSLNELFDADTTRYEALARHVPEIVILMLFVTCVMTTATLGYASGIAGERASLAAIVLVLLLALVAYLILDVDRPRSGIFRINPVIVMDLQKSMALDQTPPVVRESSPVVFESSRQ